MQRVDVIIAGGGFAGLACAKAATERGLRVLLLERKRMPGLGMHTSGILVKEAAEAWQVPPHLVRSIRRVCLYSPRMRRIMLEAPDYFFLATDTPGLMRHLSAEAEKAGASILYGTAYRGAQHCNGELILPELDVACRFLVGADGPRSQVARDFGLGINRAFLLGTEAEFGHLPPGDPDAFHCFITQRLAWGYLGWIIPGVGITQVGLAVRTPLRPDIDRFLAHVSPLFPFDRRHIVGRRGGLIPAGGPVHPLARGNVMLAGDAAGIVSPLTGGGIHTAWHYGERLGHALADHLLRDAPHPATVLRYPSFCTKRLMRIGYERAPDWLLEMFWATSLFERLGRIVFFREKRLTS